MLMRNPRTADERERRFVRYVKGLHKGEIVQLQFSQMNRMANFRKDLKRLLEEIIEVRAEEIAAGMLIDEAPERPVSGILRRLTVMPGIAKSLPK